MRPIIRLMTTKSAGGARYRHSKSSYNKWSKERPGYRKLSTLMMIKGNQQGLGSQVAGVQG